MAKGSGTPRKKAAVKVAEPTPSIPKKSAKSWFFQPRQLIISACLGITVLMVPVILRRLPKLDDRPEYQVGPEQVSITPPPRWIPPDLTKQVFELARLKDKQSLQDDKLSERIAAAFHTHPWIQKVVSVRKSFPARVHVELVYREPVAMVRGIDGHYPVDKFGILLPARDFADADVERFPVIEQVSSVPTGKLGEPWGDPVVTGAAKLAAALNKEKDGKSSWRELELAAILVPRRVALTDSADELEYELRTRGGSVILWGRGPETNHPGELKLAQKIERLINCRDRYGGFDDQHGPYQIDIRPWQGIQRGVLAKEPKDTQLQ